MKLYILSFLSILCLFSCNQKKKSEIQSIENQKIKPKETVKEVKTINIDSLTTFQLDSFFQISRDSLLDFISKNEFDKDIVMNNEFSQIVYRKAENGFPAFALLEDHACHFKNNEDCYLFFYIRENGVFKLVEKTKNINSIPFAWTPNEIELRDINFDQEKDIIIKRSIFSISREITECILVTNPNFEEIETIFTTHSLPTNPKNKTVISFTDGGNLGTNTKHINKWQGDNLVEIRRLDKGYEDEDRYILEEFVIKNGKEIKTKTQKLNQKKAEQYFENYK